MNCLLLSFLLLFFILIVSALKDSSTEEAKEGKVNKIVKNFK